VIRFVHQVTGPAVGLPALRPLFPQVSRCILADLLGRYRRVWRHRYCRKGYRLTWHVPGAVWAMDFSEAPFPIDGVCEYLFAVRDLASHYQIAWIPVPDLKAKTVLPLLWQLFQEHGPPLVLKSDNGSAFIADTLLQFLATSQVSQLFSPVRRPQFNGALERSNGTLKTYTGLHAIREGHPFRWTSDDVEHARQLANTISRPWGHKGPTPEEAWLARGPIDTQRRLAFQDAMRRKRPQAATDLGLQDSPLLAASDRRRLDRVTISRTLEQLGYLTMKRQRRRKRRRERRTCAEATSRTTACTARDKPSNTASSNDSAAHVDRVTLPATLEPRDARKETTGLLARSTERVTMVSGTEARANQPTDVRSRGSPHGERSIHSWLRRFITPPLRILKAARIL
jgi:hypothetical protein